MKDLFEDDDPWFDIAEAEAAKRKAMGLAEAHADLQWQAWMLAAVREVASRQRFLTTDDIEKLRQERLGPSTHEKRALGPLMREAQRRGLISPTHEWEPSSQRVNHRRPMRVWASRICPK